MLILRGEQGVSMSFNQVCVCRRAPTFSSEIDGRVFLCQPPRMLKRGGDSWNDPRARATRGLRRPSLDARIWDHPSHPLIKG